MPTNEALIDEMKESAEEFAAVALKLPPELRTFKPAPDQWSALEIVCHLVDAERLVLRPILSRLLAETEPYFPYTNRQHWPTEHRYNDQDFDRMVKQFIQERHDTVDLVSSVTEEKWALQGTHEKIGLFTFSDMVKRVIKHPRDHAEQIRKNIDAYRQQRNT